MTLEQPTPQPEELVPSAPAEVAQSAPLAAPEARVEPNNFTRTLNTMLTAIDRKLALGEIEAASKAGVERTFAEEMEEKKRVPSLLGTKELIINGVKAISTGEVPPIDSSITGMARQPHERRQKAMEDALKSGTLCIETVSRAPLPKATVDMIASALRNERGEIAKGAYERTPRILLAEDGGVRGVVTRELLSDQTFTDPSGKTWSVYEETEVRAADDAAVALVFASGDYKPSTIEEDMLKKASIGGVQDSGTAMRVMKDILRGKRFYADLLERNERRIVFARK